MNAAAAIMETSSESTPFYTHTKGNFYILCKVGGQVSNDVTHQLQEQPRAPVPIAFSVLVTTPDLLILKLLIRSELNGKILTTFLRLRF